MWQHSLLAVNRISAEVSLLHVIKWNVDTLNAKLMILIQWTLVDAESYSLNWIVVFCKKRSKMRTKFAFTVHHSLRHDAKLYLLLQKKLFLQQGNNAVGDRALGVAGPCVCNSLAPDITTSPSLTCFKQRLKTLLFQCAFHCNVWLCYTNIFFTVKCSQGFFDLWHYDNTRF